MMQTNKPEVADIFRTCGPAYREAHEMPLQHHKVMNALEKCRTKDLGTHKYQCDNCGHEEISYNSCRNRHCPKCQSLAREKWLCARRKELLPIPYFHIVFTIPNELNAVALINQRIVYGILFRAASETLLDLGRNPKHLGAEIGFIAVLHTWGQNLMDHPHLHCIVTGGGLSKDGEGWINPKRTSDGKDFFIHVNIISALFKMKFIAYLKEANQKEKIKWVGQISELADAACFKRLVNELYEEKWITYCKEAFGGPEQVLNYLGRYTHRVAISNNRIVSFEDDKVTFKWRDYKDQNRVKLMELEACEFIRRFLLHILPSGFFKIRYYGILSSRNRKTKLKKCKNILQVIEKAEMEGKPVNWMEMFLELTGIDLRICPKCQKGRMQLMELVLPERHAPP